MELDHYFDEVEALLLKNKKIILLEDCVNKQDEISEICLELKVDLEFFSNANKALESVLISPPDLLIVDWQLPGSMDGITFISKVRDTCSNNIPILFFTDYANPNVRLQSLENNATVFFDKSEPTQLFIAQIESLLNLSHTENNDISLSNKVLCQSISGLELKELFQFHAVVQSNYITDTSLGEVISNANLKESNLRYILHKYLKVSPQKYLIFYRFYLAARLLRSGSPIKVVSGCVNYANTANFSNIFKKIYLQTPAQYQKQNYQL